MATEPTTGVLPPVALPAFKAPPSRSEPTDPPLPPVSTSNGQPPSPNGSPSPDAPTPSPSPLANLRSRLSGSPTPSTGPDAQPPGTTSTEALTPRRKVGGDPKLVAETLAGLVLVVLGVVGARLYARGRVLREPTPAELEDITRPLGRIACRNLPMNALNEDLYDATQAVAATHRYVRRGPLTERRGDPQAQEA